MREPGYDRFAVAGHDRGAYVAFRLAMDYPEAVSHLIVADAVPIGEALARCDARFAQAWWHWFFSATQRPGRTASSAPTRTPGTTARTSARRWARRTGRTSWPRSTIPPPCWPCARTTAPGSGPTGPPTTPTVPPGGGSAVPPGSCGRPATIWKTFTGTWLRSGGRGRTRCPGRRSSPATTSPRKRPGRSRADRGLRRGARGRPPGGRAA